MWSLLTPLADTAPPRDYLLSRVRGRRARLATLPIAAESDPWQAVTTEGRWLYRQLDAGWRREFAPLLGLLEGRALASALRLAAGGEGDGGRQTLSGSLLVPELTAAARHGVVATSAVLARHGVPAAPHSRAIEASLAEGWLRHGRRHCRAASLLELLVWLIDRRNLLAFVKALRWAAPQPPAFLPGGSLPLATLEKLWRQRDLDGVRRRLAGDDGGIGARAERALQRAGRDPADPALLVDYLRRLWRHCAGEES